MTSDVVATAAPVRPAPRRVHAAGLPIAAGLLLIVVMVSLMVGSKHIPAGDVISALFTPSGSDDDAVIRELRLPRTALGVLAGAALGLAGALMQAVTRNPLADPGLLGVNQGAAVGVLIAVMGFGFSSPAQYVWFAFGGAVLATVVVFLLGAGRDQAALTRLLLAGVALEAGLVGVTHAASLIDKDVYRNLNIWAIGTIADRDGGVVVTLLPFLLAGMALAVTLAGPLNALALGDDTARGLGAHVLRTQLLSLLAVTVLCGAATAACGPIGFVGLVVPLLVRSLVGPDQRWLFAWSAVLSPLLLLSTDLIGRVAVRPAELPAGIVTELIGGVVLVLVVRRRRLVRL